MTGTANDAQRNILVVDDESQITRVFRTVLSSHGYNVRTAGDGVEALKVMGQWTPDLVITDLGMPNMGGWSCAAEYEASPQSPSLCSRFGERRKQRSRHWIRELTIT
jgi:two-component system KDP operon response regulator KdpE